MRFVCAFVFGAVVASPVVAEGPGSLREAYFGKPVQDGRVLHPSVSRFETEDGLGFVLDRRGIGARMKFDDEAHVHQLRPRHGPRTGDISYYDKQGVLMARMTALGGMMLFARGTPRPAMCVGKADALRSEIGNAPNLDAAAAR